MKYGFLFSAVAGLLALVAFRDGGWSVLALWPSLSFGAVAAAYFKLGPGVFGKSTHGRLAIPNQLLLLPYLACLWSVWHGMRFIKRESALDQLTESLFIGRRLLGHELPERIDHVIDLTCEFSEPEALRLKSYRSLQILDAYAPPVETLQQWVSQITELSGNIYIHCAEGHGRTGLIAAALLLSTGQAQSLAEAIRFIQTRRPLVRLNRHQQATLDQFYSARCCS